MFKHASIAHNNTATLPIFVETENELDDFLVGVDVVTNNMYMDMSNLSSIEYNKELEAEKFLEESNKKSIKKLYEELQIDSIKDFHYLLNSLNYKQDYKKVKSDFFDILKDKIIKGEYIYNDYVYNMVCFDFNEDEDGEFDYSYIEINPNGSLDLNTKDNSIFDVIAEESFDSINVKGKNIELKLASGKIYEYNTEKNELKLTQDPTK